MPIAADFEVAPMTTWWELEVTSRTTAADGVVVLKLAKPDRVMLPEWAPGAHIELDLGPELRRSYSLCGEPADRHTWTVAVLREVAGRGGSRHIHDHVTVGQRLRVNGPHHAFPMEPAPGYLFIAGGIGITPILPMVQQAERTGTPWRLLYGGRSARSMAFVDELRRYGTRVSVLPQDEHGLLPLGAALAESSSDTAVYACGPGPLLSALRKLCERASRELHLEYFAPPASQYGDETFEVELASTGQVLAVPADGSILSTLEEAGVPLLSSCRTGACGTCAIAVIEGQPDHRDSILTAEEKASNTYVITCVSRAKSPRLVLDC
ncbi:PDR/VanB family oxidoreductase [Streptomyces sioyaensis]|uniref:PDR/VanB family oxidoreductase n=1 Tax=Streptomyces sioyaensis TaxID=67364 RepID=UPI0036A58A0E